ncbi:hypothetical protein CCYA_CCYA02G0694 [Cyanidiococcus yangmingshanensis]|nr:hypothetical protein CCYA_CCYA02G0694 [Cyanidiococcus yangmingshanensis]
MSLFFSEDADICSLLDSSRRSVHLAQPPGKESPEGPSSIEDTSTVDDDEQGRFLEDSCKGYNLEQLREELKHLDEEHDFWQSKVEDSVLVNFGRLLEQRETLASLQETLERQQQALCQLRARLHEDALARARQLPSLEHELKVWQDRLQLTGDVSVYRALISSEDQFEMAIRARNYEEAIRLQTVLLEELRNVPTVSLEMAGNLRTRFASLQSVLLHRILEDLEEAASLTQCIEIGGYLQAMDLFEDATLRRCFLSCRGRGLFRLLSDVKRRCIIDTSAALDCPETEVALKLTRLTDALRSGILRIATEYRTVFPEDTTISIPSSPADCNAESFDEPWHTWNLRWLNAYLRIVDHATQLITDTSTLQTLYTQTMGFAKALGRLELDFRPLLIPPYERAMLRIWQRNLHLALWRYAESLQSLNWEVLASKPPATPVDLGSPSDLSPTDTEIDTTSFASTATDLLEHGPLFVPVTQLGDELESAIHQLTKLIPTGARAACASVLLRTLSDAVALVTELTFNDTNPNRQHGFVVLTQLLKTRLLPRVTNDFRQAIDLPEEELARFTTAFQQLNERLDLSRSHAIDLCKADS